MYFGLALGYLLDTVYFTQSHHNRFLQVADLLIYLAGRYENQNNVPDCWRTGCKICLGKDEGQRQCEYSTLALSVWYDHTCWEGPALERVHRSGMLSKSNISVNRKAVIVCAMNKISY